MSRGIVEPRQAAKPVVICQRAGEEVSKPARPRHQLPDAHRRQDIIDKQIEIGVYVFMPLDCICGCGFDFVDYPKAYTELITGCPSCMRSYVE